MSKQAGEFVNPVPQQPVAGQTSASSPSHKALGLPITIQRILRGVQILFAVIVLGTVGAVISANSRTNGCYDYYDVDDDPDNYTCFWTPGSFYYAIFASVWTLIISIYFIVSTFQTKIFFAVPALILDLLSVLFWFSSFVSIAVWLGATNIWWTSGHSTRSGRALLGTGTAFGAFLWLSYIAAFALNLRAFLHQRKARNTGGFPMQQQQQQQQQQPPQQQPYQPQQMQA